MSTIITILIIAIIAALVIVGLKETIKHSGGQGACCGAGATKEDEEATVQLTGEIVTRADVHIDGMHCMNCKNSVTRLTSEDERSIGRCGFKAWRGTC